MSVAKTSLFVAALLAATEPSLARIVRVPEDETSIQAGLDDLDSFDTLVVSCGTYVELLVAPPISFVMLGEFASDSCSGSFPLVDGTSLEAPDTTGVLLLPRFANTTIENFRFKNGIRNGIRSWADTVVIRHCVIDSVYYGFRQMQDSSGAVVTFENCVFSRCLFMCALLRTGNFLDAKHCTFTSTGESLRALVSTTRSVFDSCTFSGSNGYRLLTAVDGPHFVTNCVFGPAVMRPFKTSVFLRSDSTVVFENNVIMDCDYGDHAVQIQSDRPDSVQIRGNIFENCTGLSVGLSAAGALGLLMSPDSTISRGPLVSENVFVDNAGFVTCDDILPPIHVPVQIENNRFVRDSINGLPSIGGSGSQWQSTPIALRHNVFEECGFALDGSAETDALSNWWGHASGPYHETENPQGLGDSITGPVQFVPWLTDTLTGAQERRADLPTETQIAVIPNPFNSATRISFTLAKAQNVKLVVFDVLGREVVTIDDGFAFAGTHEFGFDGKSLSSGLYFARLETSRNSVTTKLVLLK